MESTEQEKDKQNPATAEDQDNMAATTATQRIDTLSRPKPVPVGFIEDRRSVYWDNTFREGVGWHTTDQECIK
ncbi:hypothetical protein OS493_034960 [Desmophyllum pertusum]|uniref:Uncharacterized protein n=1 Tax=Desmophyllum pertusum TaxID=174260 RepID=A0A9W9YIK3_9CNID|nr:hypothetical protein OS493_034960 [Desmophyllum pertusum]